MDTGHPLPADLRPPLTSEQNMAAEDGIAERIEHAERALGYRFADRDLLLAALTHGSIAGTLNYQRLEFLGDRVLALLIATRLYEVFPDEPEGLLNRRFTALVRGETLAEVAHEAGLDELMRLEAAAEQDGARQASAVLADVCEAVIGALYLDGGLSCAAEMIDRHWGRRLEDAPMAAKDAKTALQEWAQERSLGLPEYRVIGRTGPDHSPEFEVEVRVQGQSERRGRAGSKRGAEQEAAAAMLDAVDAGANRV